ncbi:MAG: Phosphoglycerate dehydrogenase [Ramlibacter sp.]|nr:Phosphoglycerate dehydrogenase [Ramlibacter sp.]
MHVHLENLTSKPLPFWLTDQLIQESKAKHPQATTEVHFTLGEDLADLDRNLATATVLVTSSGFVNHPRFPREGLPAAAPLLKFIHLIDAGVEDVMPLDWLPPSVTLTNNSGVHQAKAREFLIMSLLALNARLPEIVWNQRHAQWQQPFSSVIRGKSLLVIGLGDMGRAAVSAGEALGLTITGIRRSAAPVPGVRQIYPPSQLHLAIKDADFIVVATPLTAETRQLMDRAALMAAKSGAGLINIGRADVLDHQALLELLAQGHLGNAIIDVQPEEPLPASSPLWGSPNLIIVPHVGADDPLTYMSETMRLLCANLERLAAGQPLANVVDRVLQY